VIRELKKQVWSYITKVAVACVLVTVYPIIFYVTIGLRHMAVVNLIMSHGKCFVE
jgi:hypothetical protein